MSYQVNTLRPGTRGERTDASSHPGGDDTAGTPAAGTAQRPKGAPYREQSEWAQVALFAAGLAVGALLGAGTAFLTAPQSGVETRLALKRRARTARVQAEDRWGVLGRELRNAARRSRRTVRRKVTESRWRAADAFEA